MDSQLIVVLVLLAAAIVLFAINKPRMDVVALLVIVALPLTGILTIPETLAGFADPNVILVAAMFVVGEGLSRTGVSYRLGDWVARTAGTSGTRLLVLLMLGVAALGSVMSSTGVVAIFIPVVLSVANRLRISPRLLMMPLSFAALISGMLTLIATTPNLVVNAELVNHGHSGFGFFTITPIGLVILAVGIGYMLIARRWLGAGAHGSDGVDRRSFQDLIDDYRLGGRERRLRVQPRSPLIGAPTATAVSRDGLEMSVIAIERTRLFARTVITHLDDVAIARGDVLLVDLPTSPTDDTLRAAGLEELALREGFLQELSRQVGMAEVLVPPGSQAAGSQVRELRFRAQHHLDVIGLRRAGAAAKSTPAKEQVRVGDTLLVAGGWDAVRALRAHARDYLLLDLPAEIDEIAPAANRAPFALGILVLMVVLMVTGIVPNVIAGLIACLLMGATGCLTLKSAYGALQWPPLLVIIGMLPFAVALEKTGGVDLAAQGLLGALGGAGTPVVLGTLFLITSVTGLFVSNTATAVLMTPVALALAAALHASPYPFAMIVAVAASSAFITPMSSPVNALVIEPGRYRLFDFVKIGAPFTVIVMLISVVLVPLILPL